MLVPSFGSFTQAGLFIGTFTGLVVLCFKSWFFADEPDWDLVSLGFSYFLIQGGEFPPWFVILLAHGAKLVLPFIQAGWPPADEGLSTPLFKLFWLFIAVDWFIFAEGLTTPSFELLLTHGGWLPVFGFTYSLSFFVKLFRIWVGLTGS